MKKIHSKLMSIILAILLVVSFIGCKPTVNEPPKDDSSIEEPAIGITNQNHDFTAVDTQVDMVKNGKSDYKIVVPENYSDKIRLAKDDFVYLFNKATGVTLEVITDAELSHNPTNKYISIGETTLFETSGLTSDKAQLGKDGLNIFTKDNSVYLIGGSDSGSLYAVYDFMSICFNFEQYSPDCVEMDFVNELKLKDFNVTDIPDIPLRAGGYGTLKLSSENKDAKMFGYRMRADKFRGEYFIPIYSDYSLSSSSASSTNSNTYLPKDKYYAEHPKWFSDIVSTAKPQLCYTAHGDEAELELMIEECAKKIQFSLQVFTPQQFPDRNIVTLTMEDNFDVCNCAKCMEERERYGAESGAVVKFMNRVAEKVVTWMNLPENAEFKRDDFKLLFFAYNNFEEPPQKNLEEVKLNDHVGVWLAICSNFEFQKSFFDEMNTTGKKQFDDWSKLADFLYYWNYETNFSNYMYFYDSFSFFTSEMYKYIADKGVEMFFPQGQETCGETGIQFNNLKTYLDCKLMWNTSLDTGKLMDDYFKAMYKDAAPLMREYFNAYRMHYATVMHNNNLYSLRTNYLKIAKKNYWPLATMQEFVTMCDNAKASVEKHKDVNNEMYTAICKRIEAEAVGPMYAMLALHDNTLEKNFKNELLQRLSDDVVYLHLEMQKLSEHGLTLAESLRSFE